ncbi:hypothetical protein MIMGU_mgv1a025957mg [Erythranthe guttata]|uniref:Uncharacterized protein n=1 Tax=Erythranthe guttata TaxID=4155 RepID=A0A022Q8Z0_ERYGU|nr:hypothetical protein MIMGU_mgv1a025957mg [Erythranthe guttata]
MKKRYRNIQYLVGRENITYFGKNNSIPLAVSYNINRQISLLSAPQNPLFLGSRPSSPLRRFVDVPSRHFSLF